MRVLSLMKEVALFGQSAGNESSKYKGAISILIDLDVLNFFKERAAQLGALAYQTQVNQVLRAQMEGRETVNADQMNASPRL